MEINLTALWEKFTAPFRAVRQRVGRRPYARQRVARRQSGSLDRRLLMIKIARLLAVLGFVGVIGGVLLFFVLFAWVSKDLPKPGQVVRQEGFSTRLYDRKGKLIYDLYADQRRDPITIDQVPKDLQHATIAVEDKDFYKHQGIDPLTPIRIVYNYVFRGGRLVGGSTLTQQLVKTVLLTNERTVIRKFKEFVLALQIERSFKKDQILEMYLNEAPYGGNASGVGAASRMYFDKPVNELSLVESAVLAGLPQRPSAYSPIAGKTDSNGVPLWRVRALGVLRRMSEDSYITKEQYEQAQKDLPNVQFKKASSEMQAPHFVFYVRDLLEKQFGENVVAKGGLQITTTLDLDLQNKAQQIVSEEIDKVKNVDITNGSAMVLDPKTGEILTMVGSAGYSRPDIDGQFNVAVDGLRQPGSSIKPITYLLMFRQGFTPASMLADVPTSFIRNANDKTEKPYEPKNYDGKFRGPVSIRNSLGSSLNIPAVKSLATVGVPTFLQQAYDMGFPTLEPSDQNLKRFGLALTLGGGEVHLIDTVTAYSAFANGGTKIEPTAIMKVTDKDGHVLYEYHPVEGKRVMSPEEAYLIDNVLSDNNARLMAFGANSLLNTGKAIAVKTGTTNDKKDNWAIGWSQEVMVGAWVGNNDSHAMKQVASGVSGASPIWRRIVNEALSLGYKAPEWKVPAGVEQVDVDAVSGYPKHDEFPSHQDYALKGTVPSLPDPIHTKLKVCRGEDKLATDAKIAAGDFDEKEYIVLHEDDPYSIDGVNRWQDAINAWIGSQQDSRFKVPSSYCGDSSDTFVRITKPENQKSYGQEDVEVQVNADSGDGIEKMELWVDGAVKETVNSKNYQSFVHFPAGQHEVWVKAYSHGGKTAESDHLKIGTGGQDWKKPDPSPTPTPTPAVSPSPLVSPLPSP